MQRMWTEGHFNGNETSSWASRSCKLWHTVVAEEHEISAYRRLDDIFITLVDLATREGSLTRVCTEEFRTSSEQNSQFTRLLIQQDEDCGQLGGGVA